MGDSIHSLDMSLSTCGASCTPHRPALGPEEIQSLRNIRLGLMTHQGVDNHVVFRLGTEPETTDNNEQYQRVAEEVASALLQFNRATHDNPPTDDVDRSSAL